MKDLKSAFGTPDAEFHERVKQTLFQIEEKEEARVKKKLTFSMALAFALCICIVTVSAFAGTELLSGKPDVTQSPLAHGNNPGGNAYASSTPIPQETLTPQPSPLPVLPTPVPSESEAPDESALQATATPMPMASADPVYIWSAEGDSCYHTDRECSALTGTASRTLLAVAQNRMQSPCPLCVNTVDSTPTPMASADPVYIWSAEGDSCYHTDRECSALTGAASRTLLAVAQNRMQSPCPLCVNTVDSTPIPTYMPQATQVPGTEAAPTELAYPTPTPMQDDADNPLVYVEYDGSTFHYVSSLACTDRVGTLASMPLTDALNEGALPCRKCLVCWIGEGSDLYHMSETCSRLKSAQLQLLNTAVQADYDPCGLCVRFFDLNNAMHHRVAWCSVFGDGVNAYIPCSLSFPYLVGSAPCELCLGNESYPIATSTPMPTSEPITGYYYTADDWYCHADLSCFGEIDTTVSTASMENLIAMGKRACEDCMEPFSYYYSASDNYYHTFECAQIAGEQAEALPEDELLALGKRDCPWCLGWYNYYSSAEDGCYHKASSCDQHFGAAAFHSTEASLIEMGKQPCPECLPVPYYTTESDANFHADHACPGNQDSIITVSLEDMLSLGKTPCRICLEETSYHLHADSVFYHFVQTCTAFESYDFFEAPQEYASASGKSACPACSLYEYIFWPDQEGEHPYYHVHGECAALSQTDVTGSVQGTLLEAQSFGKALCPDCAASVVLYSVGDVNYHLSEDCLRSRSSESIVEIPISTALKLNAAACSYCITDGLYYFSSFSSSFHAVPDCSGIGNGDVSLITDADAHAAGLTPCTRCMEESESIAVFVFCTPTGTFYHAASDCSGMKNAESVPIAVALNRNQTACPVCMTSNAEPEPTAEPVQVFSNPNGNFYHAVPDCSGMKNAAGIMLAEALNLNQTACPVCMGGNVDVSYDAESSQFNTAQGTNAVTYSVDLTNVQVVFSSGSEPVFSTPTGTFYHAASDCSGMKSAESVPIAVALNRNQTACPVCTAEGFASRSNTIVYLWDANAPVYHSVFDCSGFEYRAQMGIDEAAAQEKIPCPECVNTEESVLYTDESEYYHSYRHYAYLNLPNMIASSPMEAIAAGKRACMNCILTETAKTKIPDVPAQLPPAWSTGGSECFFYDYSQDHSEALHFSADCEAMQAPVAISLEMAVEYGLWHCDLCSDDYYRHDCIVQKDDTVYHLSDTCGEFFGADRITRWDALLRGLEPCPDCAWEDIGRTGPLPTVPPQPTMPPADNQESLKAWLLSEAEQVQCLADLAYSNN